MKNLVFLTLIAIISSCTSYQDTDITNPDRIGWRALPNYTIVYQYPSGYVETEESSNLSTWSAGSTASPHTSLNGTTSTIYENDSRIMSIYQDGSGNLKYVEYVDGHGWTIPSSLSTANSALVPTLINKDGTLYEARVVDDGLSGEFVKGNNKIGYANPWSSTYYLKYGGGSGTNIPSNYSPSLEFHPNSGVDYLVTAVINHGTNLGVPAVYWRYTSSNYTTASAPSISLGISDPDELNASICPVAVDDELWLFYTAPGSSSFNELVIKYVYASVTGGGDGSFSSSWSSPASISGAYTNNKIDGFYDPGNQRIVIIFQNFSTGEIDLAYSDDFGANWNLSISGITDVDGAPSIVNL